MFYPIDNETVATVYCTMGRSSWLLLGETLTHCAVNGDTAPFTLWALDAAATDAMADDDSDRIRVMHSEDLGGLRATLEWIMDHQWADDHPRHVAAMMRHIHLEIWHACTVANPKQGFWKMAPRIRAPRIRGQRIEW